MYLFFNDKNKTYLTHHCFGTGLSYYFFDYIKKNSPQPQKISETLLSSPDQVHKFLLNFMIFSSHYIEDSLYYKKYEEVLNLLMNRDLEKIDPEEEEISTRLMSRQERKKYYKQKDQIFFRESLKLLSPILKGSKITTVEKNFILPYMIEGKQVAFSIIDPVLTVFENGEKKDYPLMRKKLFSIYENDKFVYSSPAYVGGEVIEDLECPYVKKEKDRIDEKNEHGFDIKKIRDGYMESVEDAITLGVIVKI